MDSIDTDELAKRIENRIASLGLNPTKLDKMAGLAAGFTRDLVAGRKAQPRVGNLERIAQALDCSVDYLLYGRSSTVSGTQEVPLIGYCETDVWRGRMTSPSKSGCAPDPRFPSEFQQAYEVRDDHAAEYGVPRGDTVVVLSAKGMDVVGITPGYGDLVIATSTEGSRAETRLVFLDGPEPNDKEFDIEGIVLASVRRFRSIPVVPG
ncbi:helix-turn-helix domain-containing protein [Rhizobium sp. BK176]|uniref:helix-turn-helix domain-containing protein n=1 Tax=Rhizobium sp. BK176 TaxID=2587071 RepID=UPI00216988B5|nr:helix-turn-helix transcriptional regulator [Rhizobium sp. BK176]MCS4088460.1 DNA-binding Xre family transcriptional regulator [Rhizobium sp. BK176]